MNHWYSHYPDGINDLGVFDIASTESKINIQNLNRIFPLTI